MKQNIASKARELVEKAVNDAGFTLWDVRFEKDGSDDALVFELDRGENMSMTDCEEANAIIEPIMDEADIVSGAYILEVSSAGLTRVIRTDEHFAKATENNWDVNVRFFKAVENVKETSGKITFFDDKTVTVNGITTERKNLALINAVLG